MPFVMSYDGTDYFPSLVSNTYHCSANCELVVNFCDPDKGTVNESDLGFEVQNIRLSGVLNSSITPMIEKTERLTVEIPIYTKTSKNITCDGTLTTFDNVAQCFGSATCSGPNTTNSSSKEEKVKNDSEKNSTSCSSPELLWSKEVKNKIGQKVTYEETVQTGTDVSYVDKKSYDVDSVKSVSLEVDNLRKDFTNTIDMSGSCKQYTISGIIPLNTEVDVVPCYKGICNYDFAVWNSSSYKNNAIANYSIPLGPVSAGEGIFYTSKFRQVNANHESWSSAIAVYNMSGTSIVDAKSSNNPDDQGGVIYQQNGLLGLGNQIYLNGDDCVHVPDFNYIGAGKDFSASVVVIPAALATQVILDNRETTTDCFWMIYLVNNGIGEFLQYGASCSGGNSYVDFTYSAGETMILTMTWDETNNVLKGYKNGQLIGNASGVGNGATDNNYDLLIGCQNNNVENNFLTGYVDEVYVFNKSLSYTEVQNLYYDNMCSRLLNGTDCSDIEFYNPISGQTLVWQRLNFTGLANASQNFNSSISVSFDAARVTGINQSTNASNVKVSLNGTTITTTHASSVSYDNSPMSWFEFEPGLGTSNNLFSFGADRITATSSGALYVLNSSCSHGGGYSDLGCYYFDGTSDWVQLGANGVYDITQNLTVCAWVKPTALSDGTSYAVFNNEENYRLQVLGDAGANYRCRFWIFDSTYRVAVEADGGGSVVANSWNFMCGRYDRTALNVSCWVNGDMKASFATTGDIVTSTADPDFVRIGSDEYTNSFIGYIDSVRLYNRSLSSTELLDLYRMGANVDSYWSNLSIISSGGGGAVNTAPNVTNVVLNSTSGKNLIGDNLTLFYTTSDAENNSVKGIINWVINNKSIAVLNMPFEGGSNTTYTKDYSGNTHDGVVYGAIWNATGGYDGVGAYQFNGSGAYISISNSNLINLTTNMTVELWFKMNNRTKIHQSFMGRANSVNWDKGWGFDYSNSAINFWINGYSTNYAFKAFTNDFGWHHIVGIYNGTMISIYLDGVKGTDDDYTGLINDSGWWLEIGRNGNYIDGSQNLYTNGSIDDVRIYDRALSKDEVLALYNNHTSYIPSADTMLGDNWSACVTPNDGTVDGTAFCSGGVNITNYHPSVSNIVWMTTGGFSSGTRVFNQVIDYINSTCQDYNGLGNCSLSVLDPNGIVRVSNFVMSNSSTTNGTLYNYSTDFTLDVGGTWNVNVTADDGYEKVVSTSQIVIASNNLSSVDGYYGFTNGGIISASDIATYVATYGFDLLELTLNSTNITQNFTTVESRLNTSYSTGMLAGLNLLLDVNCTNNASVNQVKSNISKYFPDLITGTYRTTLAYISLQFYNDTGYKTADINSCFNNISKSIYSATSNKFVIYNRDFTSYGIDNSYLKNTTMNYNTQNNQPVFINWEANTSRVSSYLSRVYHVGLQNSTLLAMSKNLQDSAYKILRSEINETTAVTDRMVAELDNKDVLVFNNGSAVINRSVTIINGAGKDVYDNTHKKFIEMNTDLTFLINVDLYGVTYLELDDFDHLQLTNTSVGTLFKATSNAKSNFTWTDWSRDGANQATYSLQRRTYLYDSTYQNADSFINYYGWLNSSQIQNWNVFDHIVIADKNNAEIDAIIGQTDIYGYIGVFDYSQSNATWLTAKEGEVDAWLTLNGSMTGLFLDGLDTATITNATDFETKFKSLVDYVHVTKGKKALLNTYTYSEAYSTWGDGIYKESCIRRWNGTNASSPTSYNWEDFELERNKSAFFQNHNVKVYCLAFGNRTQVNPIQLYNYSIMLDAYYAAKVLGYDYFSYQQPDFQYALDLWLPNVGNDLSNTWSTEDNQTFYRAYSNGIVYYNSSSHHGWQDNGRVLNSVKLHVNLFDNSAQTYYVSVTDGLNQVQNKTIITAGDGWSYDDYAIPLNATASGRYVVTIASPTGGYIGMDTTINNYQGIRSWFSMDTGASWTGETENNFYLLAIEVNDTYKSSMDSKIPGVTQSQRIVSGKTNVTLSGDSSFNITTWSLPFAAYLHQYWNLSYWTGTVYSLLYPVNTNTCDGDNPLWNTTIINSETYLSCYNTSGNWWTFRVAAPHLSTQLFQVQGNAYPEGNVLNVFLNSTFGSNKSNETLNVWNNTAINDSDQSTKYKIIWYFNGTANSSLENFTNTSSPRKGTVIVAEFWPYDGLTYGVPINTSVLTVLNTEPYQVKPSVYSGPYGKNYSNENLYCVNQSTSDADGDLVVNELVWFKNGTEQTALENSSSVSKSITIMGDVWICQVTPNDGLVVGSVINSSSLYVNAVDCGIPINEYTALDDDVNASVGDTCFSMNGSDSVFDCNGYAMTGNGGVGFYFLTGNITVINCNVSGFSNAVVLDSVVGGVSLTENILNGTSADINASSSSLKAWNNHFYGAGVINVSGTLNLCVGGDGNFWRSELVPLGADCGKSSINSPTNLSSYGNNQVLIVGWDSQSMIPGKIARYVLEYEYGAGSGWVELYSGTGTSYSWNVGGWGTGTYGLRVTPFDGVLNGTRKNISIQLNAGLPPLTTPRGGGGGGGGGNSSQCPEGYYFSINGTCELDLVKTEMEGGSEVLETATGWAGQAFIKVKNWIGEAGEKVSPSYPVIGSVVIVGVLLVGLLVVREFLGEFVFVTREKVRGVSRKKR